MDRKPVARGRVRISLSAAQQFGDKPMETQAEYKFSDRERLYFDRLQQQFNTSMSSGIQMILMQQAFEGQWRIKSDGSGIERIDMLQRSLALEEVKKAEVSQKVNGLAD
jgi:hypothetical protein